MVLLEVWVNGYRIQVFIMDYGGVLNITTYQGGYPQVVVIRRSRSFSVVILSINIVNEDCGFLGVT